MSNRRIGHFADVLDINLMRVKVLDKKFKESTNFGYDRPFTKQNNLPLLCRRSYPTPAKTEAEVKTKNQDLPVTEQQILSTKKEPGIYYSICNSFK